jgi:UDP-2,3-diacylglucosamine pyrophosphatase LpxH
VEQGRAGDPASNHRRPRRAAPDRRLNLSDRFGVWRRVAAAIPQRHQSESRGFRYLRNFARDTVWPPSRAWRILRTWRREAGIAADFARAHRPAAKFVIIGHTHRPYCNRTARGTLVINTGSFCRPLGGCFADITHDRLVVRRIKVRRGEFHPGKLLAEFPFS